MLKRATEYSDRELCTACERIADLVSLGQPIDRDALLIASGDSQESACLQSIATDLESGAEISDVLPSLAGQSAGTLRAAVLVGQLSGTLDHTLIRWVQMRQSATRCKQASRVSLAYPAFVALCFLVSVVFVFQFVVPQYVTIARGSGELPQLIKILSWLQTNLWIVVAATAFVLSLPFVWAFSYVRRSALHRTSLEIVAMQEFAARLAGLMVRQAVPLETANPLLRLASGDPETDSLQNETSTNSRQQNHSQRNEIAESLMHPLLSDVLDELESGIISQEQAIHFVDKIASQLEILSNRAAVSRVSWLSTVVTVMVAVGAAGIYIVLIYLPWTQVLMQLEETGR